MKQRHKKNAFQHPDVSIAVEYIDNNFSKRITLAHILDQCKVSRKTLEKYFKAELNCSPNEYIITKKLDHVKKLLSESSLSIGQLAQYSGFKDGDYMGRLFKQRFNITPREYRKSHRL